MSTCPKKAESLFFGLAPDQLKEIDDRGIPNTYKKNQAIFLQGNSSHGVFCLHSGSVKIEINNGNGKESIVRLVAPGDFFGHRAIFGNKIYQASAITLENSHVIFFEQEFFFRVIKDNPPVAFNLLTELSQLAGLAEESVVSISHQSVRERLAGLLITLKESYGVQDAIGVRLDIKLTREDMASMIGTSIETIARLFTEFKEEKIVFQEAKVLFIVNEKKLIEFANNSFIGKKYEKNVSSLSRR
jgi:CRP-like cAMP-binding protein